MEDFRKELTELCKKHGLENAAFCANKDNKFFRHPFNRTLELLRQTY